MVAGLIRKLRNLVINSLLVVVSTAAGLYVLEAYLAYEEWEIELGTGARIQRAAEAAGASWDKRDKVEVIRDLRASGEDAFPSMAPTILVDDNGLPYGTGRLFPFGGISDTVNVFCNEMGDWSIYRSDEHGFNNPKGMYANGALDAALVGDSFTHGACLPEGGDIASQIRGSGYRALNLGIGGAGPLTYLAVQREYAKPAEPKTVFWMFYAVDIRDSVYEQAAPLLMSYLDDPAFSQHLIDRQPELDEFLRDYMNKGYQQKLDELTEARQKRREIITKRLLSNGLRLTKLRERLRNLGGRDAVLEGREAEKLALLRRILETAKTEIEGWGGNMVFVYLPDWYTYAKQYDTYGIKIDENFLLRQDVLRLAGDVGLPVIDIQGEIFDRHPDPVSLYNWRMYGHYNTEGYRLVSDRLIAYLGSRPSGTSGR